MIKFSSFDEYPPTLLKNQSLEIFSDTFKQKNWRCYVSTLHPGVELLCKRFLNAHAQVPGGFTEATPAYEPLDTFAFTINTAKFKGMVFLNGAVIRIIHTYKTSWLLYIDETTASVWGYPKIFLSYEDRINRNRRIEQISDSEIDTSTSEM